mgnify:CR=1 FL=1
MTRTMGQKRRWRKSPPIFASLLQKALKSEVSNLRFSSNQSLPALAQGMAQCVQLYRNRYAAPEAQVAMVVLPGETNSFETPPPLRPQHSGETLDEVSSHVDARRSRRSRDSADE